VPAFVVPRPAWLAHNLGDAHNLSGIRPDPVEDTWIAEFVPRERDQNSP